MENNHTRPLLKAGDYFGDYVVERLLGEGGMGAVYLVRTESGLRYAVKVMYPDMMSHDLRVRFAREAKFAMGVRHKNLISVYDVGEDPETGLCYIIMDYVPGGSLSDKIKESGRLPIQEAVSIATQIASGLDAAHRRGLVHRDVKPDNILFDADGTPKLADLGIAKHESDTGTMVTMAGEIIGTPAYMSPEQLMDSHRIDARADIYSLGVVLYEMLAGIRPNRDSTAIELLAKAIKGEELPDIRTMRPEISTAVALVLSRMCAANPDNRPATALDAAKLLQKAATGKLVLKRKPPTASVAAANERKATLKNAIFTSLAAVWVIFGLLAIGIAMFVLFMFMRNKSAAPHEVVVTNVVEKVRVVTIVTNEAEHAAVVTSEKPNPSAGKPTNAKNAGDATKKARGVTDKRVRFTKVGDHTWFYTLENGEAVIWRGSSGYNNETRPAVDPSSGEHLSVPAELDGHKVCAIGNLAFFRCQALKSIEIPEGIREIRGWAFYDCKSLETVMLPDSLSTIKGGAFDYCTALSEIDIGQCSSISGTAFKSCPKLAVIKVAPMNPNYLSVDGALYSKDRRELVRYPPTRTSVHLLEPVRKIGAGAFSGCKNIREMIIPDVVEVIEDSALSWCSEIEEFTAPLALRKMGSSAFRGCNKLERVVFQEGLEEMGNSTFSDCKKLIEVDFRGNAPRIDGSSSSVLGETPENLVIVVRRGSKGWSAPDSTELPERWPDMGFEDSRPIRFEDDIPKSLDKKVAAVQPVVPKTAKPPQASPNTKKGPFARTVLFPILDRSPAAWTYSFVEEIGWKEVGFDDQKWNRAPGGFGSRDNGGQRRARINTVWQTNRIFLRRHFNWDRMDVTRAVLDLYHDDDVTIYLNGQWLMTISGENHDWQPFEIPLRQFAAALRQGENVLCIEVQDHGGSQYFDCGLLVECGGDTTDHAGPYGMRKVKTDAGTWTVMVKDGVAQIGDGQNVALDPRPGGRLDIPSELDGLKIRKLAQNCFKGCEDLESVTIPEGVFSVGQGAFFNCRHLVEVSVPNSLEHLGIEGLHGTKLKEIDLKNVRLIEGGVFKFCDKLEKISVNSDNLTYYVNDGVLYDRVRRAVAFCPRSRKAFVFPNETEEIYDCAFQRSKIKSIVIPETVVVVGHCAFNECPFLESVKFKGQDAILGGWSFGNTPSLKSVTLPSRLKALEDWSIFNNAGELESIVLPDTLETIDDAVFANCKKLKRISLGKSLRRVSHRAFAGCVQLQSIVFPNTLTELGAEVFLNCVSLKTVSFTGNAPDLEDQGADRFGRDLFKGTDPSLNIHVSKGSTGWKDNSSALPVRWPLDGGESARAIKVDSMHQSTK